jgi:hypothetical protein
MLAGALQVLPLNVSAMPAPPTATQNDEDGQDTDESPWPLGSMLAGALQVLPLNVSALPAPSTATQNDEDGHDTDDRL